VSDELSCVVMSLSVSFKPFFSTKSKQSKEVKNPKDGGHIHYTLLYVYVPVYLSICLFCLAAVRVSVVTVVCVSLSDCLYACSIVWLLYVCLTAVHLYANYRAVTAVTMDTFNQSRLHIVIGHWLTSRQVLSVTQANQREPVFTGTPAAIFTHDTCMYSPVCVVTTRGLCLSVQYAGCCRKCLSPTSSSQGWIVTHAKCVTDMCMA